MRELIAAAVSADCLLDAGAAAKYAVQADRPSAVVAPRSAAEAAAVLQLASREGFTVECAGAGTRLHSGNRSRQPFIALSSVRLNDVAEYEPADLVISVGAGVSFPKLHDAVSPHNQFLALDPAVSRESTLGAAIATGASGPLRYAHGTPRDHVLGLEIVTGDGRILRFGGKVVKNVAGYDLVRLIVGSRGTLGFITSVNLRLKPAPQMECTLAIGGATLEAAADAVDAILAATFEPVALEILSPMLAEQVGGGHVWTVLIRFHGNGGALADAEQRIRALAGGVRVTTAAHNVWQLLAQAEAAATVKLRFANARASVRATMAAAQRASQAAVLENAQLAVHAGDGIVRLLAQRATDEPVQALLHARAELEAQGGTLIIERCTPALAMDAFGTTEGIALMTGIKKAFDPAGILAPGRFVI